MQLAHQPEFFALKLFQPLDDRMQSLKKLVRYHFFALPFRLKSALLESDHTLPDPESDFTLFWKGGT